MRLILLIGVPGSGKGTICHFLTTTYPDQYCHISAGDMIREEISRQTDLGRRLQGYYERAQFVPDEIVIDMILSCLRGHAATGKCVLLDGFPRTPKQAKQLNQTFRVERIILLQSPDDICMQRVRDRRIDPITGVAYNLQSLPPPTEEIARRLVLRDQHTDEDISRRVRNYHGMLGRILGLFKGKMFVVDSSHDIRHMCVKFEEVLAIQVQGAANEEPVPQAAPAPVTIVVKDKKGTCVICRNAPADYLITPCGHQCGCEACFDQLRQHNQPCPICRSRIQGVVHVFQSGFVDTEGEEKPPESHRQEDDVDDDGWGPDPVAVPPADDDAVYKITIDVAPCDQLRPGSSATALGVTIQVPDVMQSVPIDICCVIDISGSMGEDAKSQDPDDNTKWITNDFSQIDLVKHAVKTIILTLSDRDRLSLVAFDNVAETVFALGAMDEVGKRAAVTALERLDSRNSTNIWAGLQAGLDSLRAASDLPPGEVHRRKRFLLFLTDGQPTESPPQGESECVKHYFELHPEFKCMISTFGFGYALKSKLMLDIAREAGGTFAFIPDASTLGTHFVSAVANARSCICLDAKLHLTPKKGVRLNPVPCMDATLPCLTVPWGVVVRIGPIHAGQSRDLCVQLQLDPETNHDELIDVTLEYEMDTVVKVGAARKTPSTPTSDSVAAGTRSLVVSQLADITTYCDRREGKKAIHTLQELIGKVTVTELATQNPRITALLADLNGRISKSVSTAERWNRWGGHYLRGLFRSHQYQMQTNLLDPGLQVYGGSQFKSLILSGGEVFVTLRMKKYSDRPTNDPLQSVLSSSATQPAAAPRTAAPPPADNSNFYARGDCFGGVCTVVTSSLIVKQVSEVVRGDRLLMADGTFLLVEIVVELQSPRKDLVYLQPSGLLITPTHPIRFLTPTTTPPSLPTFQGPLRNGWVRPHEVPGAILGKPASRVFNVIFDRKPTCGLMVNGIECVTYYHDIPELHHAFYSTDVILEKLATQDGFHEGYCRIAIRPISC